jgi:hypothetical protein
MIRLFFESWAAAPGAEVGWWTFVNIVLAVVFPFIIVLGLANSGNRKKSILEMVGKGELYWAVMTMAAAAIYEFVQLGALMIKVEHPAISINAIAVLILFLAGIILVAAGSVGTIAAGTRSVTAPSGVLIFWSAFYLLVVSTIFFFAHVALVAEQIKDTQTTQAELVKQTIITYECKRLKKPNCEKGAK